MQKIILFILLLVLEISCSSIKTVAPVAQTDIPAVVLKSSYISVPIEIDTKDLEKKINQEVNGVLYNDESFDKDDVKIKVWKKANFSIDVVGNELFYTVPLKIGVKYKKIVEFPEVFADITIKFKTQFWINKDWSVVTKTSTLGFDWGSSQGISVGGFTLPLQTISDLVLSSNQEKLNAEIDNAIQNELNLKTYGAKAWSLAHKPIEINNDPKVWLKMAPFELYTVPITGKNGKIMVNLAIRSVNEIMINNLAPAYKVSILPDLKIVQKISPQLSLNFNVDLPFEKINELASKELLNKKFSSGKKHVMVKGFKCYASGASFIAELQVEGSIKGFIYLKGKPIYSQDSKKIEVKEIEFDLDTKNKLLKSAEWLLHNNIVKLLEEQLSFSIEDKLEEAKKMANDNLKNNKSVTGITLNGKVDEISIDQIYVMPNAIKTTVLLTGKLFVSVDGLSKL